jgi:hypothetical protein
MSLSSELGTLSREYCEIEARVIEQSDRLAEILWGEYCPAFRSLYYDRNWQPDPGAQPFQGEPGSPS